MNYDVTFQAVATVEADSPDDAANIVRRGSFWAFTLSEPEILDVTPNEPENDEQ